ncbi:hypothetical protein, partial [Nocardia neocaledoniensis]|uniref:hypothetical protein n=1 Tax=Nocardia neocaledoniensis TaxID=236511 RepID=UPI0011BDEFDC
MTGQAVRARGRRGLRRPVPERGRLGRPELGIGDERFVEQLAQPGDVGRPLPDLGADLFVYLGELVEREPFVLVDAAVAEPLVDLGDLLVVGVGDVGAEEAGVVAARAADGVVGRGWQRGTLGEIVGADFAQEVEGVARMHRWIVADGARVGGRVVDQVLGVRIDLRQCPHVVGERAGEVVQLAARGPVRQRLGQR